jgi:hypothetical protein
LRKARLQLQQQLESGHRAQTIWTQNTL